MRFPFTLSAKMARHIIGNKIKKTGKFAMVLQLEPLHTCNLTCTGCGRIREYSTTLKDMMPLEECLGAAKECDAPMVSICGGEPLIYPKIEELVDGLLDQGRIVYICTNGMFMRKKMRDYLAARISRLASEPKLKAVAREELITDKDADEIRKGQGRRPSRSSAHEMDVLERPPRRPGIHPRSDRRARRRFQGMHRGHQDGQDPRLPGRHQHHRLQGDRHGRRSSRCSSISRSLGVDGHTISPGYEYDAAKKDMVKRLNKQPEDFFLTRKMTRQKFSKIEEWGETFTIFGTPVYQEFLAGKRDLTCTAWAIPTRNVRGWKAPVLPDDRRPLRRLPGNARRRWSGTNTAWSTAWRAIRAARIAWCIAATTHARARHRHPARRHLEDLFATTSARSRNLSLEAPKWTPITA